MNIIDKTIELFAPNAAKRRMAARIQLDALRAYDGASQGRRVQNWRTTSSDADAEILAGGARLRDRARDTVRNSPHGAKLVSLMADNLVGEGIMPRAVVRDSAGNIDEEKSNAIDHMFDIWAKKSQFYAKQYTAVRGMVESGEMLAMRRIGKKSKPLPGQKPEDIAVALDFSLLEPDYLDDAKQGGGGSRIIAGVEYDQQAVRTGYWLFDQHPGAPTTTGGTTTSKKVPAEEIAHLFESQRPQSRGVTWLAPILVPLRELGEYEAAELVRKKIEACVVGIVTNPDEDVQNPGIATQAGVVDANGNPVERFEPGLIAYARGGKDIKFNSPSVTAGYEAYKRAKLREIASGGRVPYMLLADDMNDANFASGRLGILEFRRLIRSIQWHFIIPLFCEVIWNWFIMQAKAEGLIEDSLFVEVEWSPPRFDQISPIDDTRAEILQVRAGFRSQQDVVSGYGRQPRVVLKEIEDHNTAVDNSATGIILDTDPRKVTLQGMLQMESTGDKADGRSEK